MGSYFDEAWEAEAQPAIDEVTGETVTVLPMKASKGGYKEAVTDPDRIVKETRGRVSYTPQTRIIDGNRRGGELSGFAQLSLTACEVSILWIYFSQIGYEPTNGDRLRLDDQPQKPVYAITDVAREPGRRADFSLSFVEHAEPDP